MRRLMGAIGTLLIVLPGLLILLVGVGLMLWGWLTFFFPSTGRIWQASTGSGTLVLGALIAFIGLILALLPFTAKMRRRADEEHEHAGEAGPLPHL